MTRPRAADDFEAIRSRVKTLQRIYQDNGDSIPAVNPKGARYMTQFGNTIPEQRAGLTPEREWETALRLSRERFQRFFANAPVGIALIDRFGRGAVFQIYLPRHKISDGVLGTRAENIDTAEPPAIRDLTGIGTVMLVEDEDPVRIFGARALRNKGYTVLEAKSGDGALEMIREAEEKIDLLITDVVMPRMDGPALVRQVREIHPDITVIFIVG